MQVCLHILCPNLPLTLMKLIWLPCPLTRLSSLVSCLQWQFPFFCGAPSVTFEAPEGLQLGATQWSSFPLGNQAVPAQAPNLTSATVQPPVAPQLKQVCGFHICIFHLWQPNKHPASLFPIGTATTFGFRASPSMFITGDSISPFAFLGSATLMDSGSFGMSVAVPAPPPSWSTQL